MAYILTQSCFLFYFVKKNSHITPFKFKTPAPFEINSQDDQVLNPELVMEGDPDSPASATQVPGSQRYLSYHMKIAQ